jgi:hypothetical protein
LSRGHPDNLGYLIRHAHSGFLCQAVGGSSRMGGEGGDGI